MTFSWLNYPPWPPCPPCLTMLQMQMLCAGQIQYHFGRNISPETTSPGQLASSELTNVVPAPPKVLEMDWNQTEVTLYVRRRANLSKFCWYVTFWKFPSHSKILQTLTEGCGNRLSICQVRCVAVFVAPSYYISWHLQIERRWHCLQYTAAAGANKSRFSRKDKGKIRPQFGDEKLAPFAPDPHFFPCLNLTKN